MQTFRSDIRVVDFLAVEMSGACIQCFTPLSPSPRKRRPRKYCDDACRMNRQRRVNDQPRKVKTFVPLHDVNDYCSVCHILMCPTLRLAATRHPECEQRKPIEVTVRATQWVCPSFQIAWVVVPLVYRPINQFYVKIMERVSCKPYQQAKITGIAPKIRGKLHTIGGRWCKCDECLAERQKRINE